MRSLLLLSAIAGASALQNSPWGATSPQAQGSISPNNRNYRHFASTTSCDAAMISESDEQSQATSGSSDSSIDTAAVPSKWEAICEKVFENDERPVILFDGDCGLCTDSVNFAIDHDPEGEFDLSCPGAVSKFSGICWSVYAWPLTDFACSPVEIPVFQLFCSQLSICVLAQQRRQVAPRQVWKRAQRPV